MLIAVLGDSHSNLAALMVVIKDLLSAGAQRVFCLGDTIGYFAHPRECLELLQSLPIPVDFLRGNHEDMLDDEIGQEDIVNELSLWGIRHSDRCLTKEQSRFLQALPRALFFDDLGLAISHDNFTLPGSKRYAMPDCDINGIEPCYVQLKVLEAHPRVKVSFLGHTHIPYFYGKVPGQLRDVSEHETNGKTFELLPEGRYIINPGSAGQPRDHDTRAAYGILDTGSEPWTFCFRRLKYDVESSIKAIDCMQIGDERTIVRMKDRLKRGW